MKVVLSEQENGASSTAQTEPDDVSIRHIGGDLCNQPVLHEHKIPETEFEVEGKYAVSGTEPGGGRRIWGHSLDSTSSIATQDDRILDYISVLQHTITGIDGPGIHFDKELAITNSSLVGRGLFRMAPRIP